MRQMVLILTLTPEEEALFQGRLAMVTPLNEGEKEVLRNNIGGLISYIEFNRRCIATLQQALETSGDKEGQIAKTLRMMVEPGRAANELVDQVRQLLGRSAFVGPSEAKGPVQ